jgi:hypothetical protein
MPRTTTQERKAKLAAKQLASQRKSFFQKVKREAYPKLITSTVPIFVVKHKEPEPHGTGVLLSIADRLFLISAAHVFDDPKECGWHIGLGGLTGERFAHLSSARILSSRVPDGAGRSSDPLDLLAAELPPHVAQELTARREPIRLGDIALDTKDYHDCWYLICGYPRVLSSFKAADKRVEYQPLLLGTVAYKHDRGAINHDKPDKHIALNFPSSGTMDDFGNPSSSLDPYDPHCVSGCGIWRLTQPQKPIWAWNKDDLKLVGIEHSWYEKTEVLAGTRIHLLLIAVYRAYPDLRTTFHLNFDTRF